mmetsp:Transcript_7717/g.15897  ORF Transcript_7717/g.15897 Transcript_7717/m.15897 type:complete len:258 (+) Transcript_7717:442-1215(+)
MWKIASRRDTCRKDPHPWKWLPNNCSRTRSPSFTPLVEMIPTHKLLIYRTTSWKNMTARLSSLECPRPLTMMSTPSNKPLVLKRPPNKAPSTLKTLSTNPPPTHACSSFTKSWEETRDTSRRPLRSNTERFWPNKTLTPPRSPTTARPHETFTPFGFQKSNSTSSPKEPDSRKLWKRTDASMSFSEKEPASKKLSRTWNRAAKKSPGMPLDTLPWPRSTPDNTSPSTWPRPLMPKRPWCKRVDTFRGPPPPMTLMSN